MPYYPEQLLVDTRQVKLSVDVNNPFFKFLKFLFLAHVKGKIGGKDNDDFRINSHLTGQDGPSHPFWRNHEILRQAGEAPLQYNQRGRRQLYLPS